MSFAGSELSIAGGGCAVGAVVGAVADGDAEALAVELEGCGVGLVVDD